LEREGGAVRLRPAPPERRPLGGCAQLDAVGGWPSAAQFEVPAHCRFGCCHLQFLCFSELKPNLTQPVLLH